MEKKTIQGKQQLLSNLHNSITTLEKSSSPLRVPHAVLAMSIVEIDQVELIEKKYGSKTTDEIEEAVKRILDEFLAPSLKHKKISRGRFVIASKATETQTLGIAEMIRRKIERLSGQVQNPDGERLNIHWRVTASLGLAFGQDATLLLKGAHEALRVKSALNAQKRFNHVFVSPNENSPSSRTNHSLS